MINYLDRFKNFIQIGISLAIFTAIIWSEEKFHHISFSNVIYLLLSFIVVIEIINMIQQYLVNHFIQLRLVIDTFFIFILRETILVYTNHDMKGTIELFNINNMPIMVNEKLFYIVLGVGVMGILMFFRVKAMTSSPNETNCKKCPSKNCCEHKDTE